MTDALKTDSSYLLRLIQGSGMEEKHEVINCNTLDQFLDVLRLSNTKYWGESILESWLFRGHADEDWPLLPKLWRDSEIKALTLANKGLYDNSLGTTLSRINRVYNKDISGGHQTELNKLCFTSLMEFFLASNFAGIAEQLGFVNYQAWGRVNFNADKACLNNRIDEMSDEYFLMLALCQHYGIPTRLLDWTRTPTAAISFAAFDHVASTCCCVWAIRSTNLKHFRVNPDLSKPSFLTSDRRTNPNSKAQDAAFTAILNPDDFFIANFRFPSITDFGNSIQIRKVRFPWSEKERDMLRTLLIREHCSPAHLKPSLENCAKYALDVLPIRGAALSKTKK